MSIFVLQDPQTRTRPPTFALALGGGGARGYSHIHVIEALDEMGIAPIAIAGTSMGSIVGAAFASGMSGREIREYAVGTLGSTRGLLSRLWDQKALNVKALLGNRLRLIHFDILRLLPKLLPAQLPHNFEDLKVPLHILASDLYAASDVVMNSGPLLDAIAASSSIPGVFEPVRRDNRLLVDGVATNPVPFEYLMNLADIVIAVDITPTPETNGNEIPSSFETLQGSMMVMQRTIINEKIRFHQPHVVLQPELNGWKTSDFTRVSDILATSAGIKEVAKLKILAAIQNYYGKQEDMATLMTA